MSSAVVTQVQSNCLIPSWPSLFSFYFCILLALSSKSFKPTWVYTRSNGELASSSKRKTTGSNQAHSSYISTRNYIITCQQQKFRKKKRSPAINIQIEKLLLFSIILIPETSVLGWNLTGGAWNARAALYWVDMAPSLLLLKTRIS